MQSVVSDSLGYSFNPFGVPLLNRYTNFTLHGRPLDPARLAKVVVPSTVVSHLAKTKHFFGLGPYLQPRVRNAQGHVLPEDPMVVVEATVRPDLPMEHVLLARALARESLPSARA